MIIVRRSLALLFLLLPAPVPSLWAQQDHAASVLSGISNDGRNQKEPYGTAGDRSYLIGTQDGNFPDLGGHTTGEMGGLWVHPIKLIDGFWGRITDTGSGKTAGLTKSKEFVNYPYGGRFVYGKVFDDLEVERFEFAPDGYEGVVIQYTFRNTAAKKRALSFEFTVRTDLLPVWYSEKLGITDAPDSVAWNSAKHLFVARDTKNPWFAVWGAAPSQGTERLANPPAPATRGTGATGGSRHPVSVAPNGTSTLTFVIAGSATSRTAAEKAYTALAQNHPSLLAKKKAHYTSLVQRARINIPDQRLQEVYNWVKINTEWLVRDVPGIGRGQGGGLMEYPWWFSDSYSYQALIAMGHFDLAKQSIRLVRDQSAKANGNGRIVHEITTNGGIVNPGNTQETAQFVVAIGKLIQATGDRALAKEMYPTMKQGLHWLLVEADTNRNLFPEGYGIMEVLGLNAEVIDVAVYTQQALLATSKVAALLGEPETASKYRRQAEELALKINDAFWIEDQTSYGDFYGTRAQALAVADGAIKQLNLKKPDEITDKDKEAIAHYEGLKAKWAAMPDTTRAWITNENWVISTPMEMGIAPRDKAVRLLDRIRKENVGEYGPFLSAIEEQRMMTIATGVQAVAESRYARTDEAMWYVGRIVGTFNRMLPGSISEMMPDWGCFTIAWTNYGIVISLIEHVFGIQADAAHKRVVFDPHLPDGWEDISIANLPVGTDAISFSRAKTDKGIEYIIDARQNGWTFVLKGKAPPDARVYVNGKEVANTPSGIQLKGRKSQVLIVSPASSR
jgi:hypothetical protein